MVSRIIYPTVDDLVITNIIMLSEIRVKRGDSHKVLSYKKLEDALDDVKNVRGDVYDKSAQLMVSIARAHAFASANRRTAYAAAKSFLLDNCGKWNVKYEDSVMTGIREGFYIWEDVRDWLKGHGIRKFSRW